MTIHHEIENQRFVLASPDQRVAELVYERPEAGVIDFVHTYVPEGQRGQGEADELARAGLAFARQQHLRVRTSCPFMAAFVARHHNEYAAILA